jgi:hypothetical protein
MTQVNSTSSSSAWTSPTLRQVSNGFPVEATSSTAPTMGIDQMQNSGRNVKDRLKGMVGLGSERNFKQLVSDMKWGMAISAPIEAIFASQDYRNGKFKANEYIGKVASRSVSDITWTAGAWAANTALKGVLPTWSIPVIGIAAGFITHDIWDRSIGKSISHGIAKVLPEEGSKPVANAMSSVGNVLHDYLWKPVSGFVMGNKLLSAAAVGLLAWRFPGIASAAAKGIGTMAAGTGIGMGVSHFGLSKVMPKSETEEEMETDDHGKPRATVTTGQPNLNPTTTAQPGGFLGELGNGITVDPQLSTAIRTQYASMIEWKSTQIPETFKQDLEKMIYVSLLSEESQDPTEKKQLDQLATEMDAKLQTYLKG